MPRILESTKCEECKYHRCMYGFCKKYRELDGDNMPMYVIFNLQRYKNTIITTSALNKIGKTRFERIIKQEIAGITEIIFRKIDKNISQTRESYVVEVR